MEVDFGSAVGLDSARQNRFKIQNLEFKIDWYQAAHTELPIAILTPSIPDGADL